MQKRQKYAPDGLLYFLGSDLNDRNRSPVNHIFRTAVGHTAQGIDSIKYHHRLTLQHDFSDRRSLRRGYTQVVDSGGTAYV